MVSSFAKVLKRCKEDFKRYHAIVKQSIEKFQIFAFKVFTT